MNAANEPSVMNANKAPGIRHSAFGGRKFFFNRRLPIAVCLFALFVFLPALSHAQGAAPGMSGVQEVVVQYARFVDPKAADNCGLQRETITNSIVKNLTDSNVPAMASANAKPPMMGVARIELVPEISTISNGGLDCTSWVSLTAQTSSNARIPPIDVLRNVKIVYWQQGVLLASAQSTHPEQLRDTMQTMALQFGRQYRLDQPPVLPKQ